MEVVGMIGACLLGACCLPQTVKTLRTGKADDVSWAFLLMWLGGELLMLNYVLSKDTTDSIIVLNFLMNIILLIPIMFIKSGLYSALRATKS